MEEIISEFNIVVKNIGQLNKVIVIDEPRINNHSKSSSILVMIFKSLMISIILVIFILIFIYLIKTQYCKIYGYS